VGSGGRLQKNRDVLHYDGIVGIGSRSKTRRSCTAAPVVIGRPDSPCSRRMCHHWPGGSPPLASGNYGDPRGECRIRSQTVAQQPRSRGLRPARDSACASADQEQLRLPDCRTGGCARRRVSHPPRVPDRKHLVQPRLLAYRRGLVPARWGRNRRSAHSGHWRRRSRLRRIGLPRPGGHHPAPPPALFDVRPSGLRHARRGAGDRVVRGQQIGQVLQRTTASRVICISKSAPSSSRTR